MFRQRRDLSIPSRPQTRTPDVLTRLAVHMSLHESTGLLDYSKCSPAKLRDFIRARTTVGASENELKQWRKPSLVTRLRTLDKRITFRFLDLVPELRLQVYEHVLVKPNHTASGRRAPANGAALLRTCKLVHEEAEPILYRDNKFSASIGFYKDPNDSNDEEGACECGPKCRENHHIELVRPGRVHSYIHSEHSRVYWWIWTLASCNYRVTSCQSFHIFRSVRHLTLRLGSCDSDTQTKLARLCLLLSGPSQLKKLTVAIHQRHTILDTQALVEVLSPIALLNLNVELELADGSKSLQTELHKSRKTLRAFPSLKLKSLGDRIASTRLEVEHSLGGYSAHWHRVRSVDWSLEDILRWIALQTRESV